MLYKYGIKKMIFKTVNVCIVKITLTCSDQNSFMQANSNTSAFVI
jgi:hypothetical protein